MGGGTGAGKTTAVRRLAERSGLSTYDSDETIPVHGAKLSAVAAPLLDRFRRMSMDERWVLREPREMYRTFPWFQGEGFELLIEDLQSLPSGRITIVEGFRLLPDLVGPLLSEADHALWLIPTPAFTRAAFAARDPSEAFWLRTRDPQRALANLLARDEIQAAEVKAAAERNGLVSMTIDAEHPVDVTVAAIGDQFEL